MALNFDPYNQKDFRRLQQAVKENLRRLDPFRKVRKMVKEAVQGHYYDSDDDQGMRRDPVNPLDQYQNTLVRTFVQARPIARVTSRTQPKQARIFEAHLNEVIKEIDLVNTLRWVVQEAILGYGGRAYCGISPTVNDPAGESFCDPVSLPDFVIDLSHEEVSQADLIGHSFSRRIGELHDNPLYDQEMVALLETRSSSRSELDNGKDRKRRNNEEGSVFDWTDLWSIMVRPANLVIVMSLDGPVTGPLRVESYDGPEFGPYVDLSFDRVMDELMPQSRGALLLDLHDFVVGQYRRMFIKEDKAAEFFTFEGGSEEDARNIRDAVDNEMVRVNDNKGVVRRNKGGTNPNSMAIGIHSRSLFDEFSNNVRVTGGVGPIAETATQERIANANINRTIEDMNLQVIGFTRRVLQNIAWHEWTHPTRTRRVEVKIGKNGRAIEQLWSPQVREGDFIEHEIDIVPDSMVHRTGRQQLEELMRAVQSVVVPVMQLPSERPIILRGPELLQKYSDLAQLPELQEVVDYAADEAFVSQPRGSGPATGGGGGGGGGGAPSGGGGGGGSNDPGAAIVQQVLSGAVRPDQNADSEEG